MQKEEYYRGKTIEELKSMDLREFAKLLNSRERRSVLRGAEKISKFLNRCDKKISRKKIIKTHSREMIIVPKMVGMTMGIHNGKEFISVQIDIKMIGHRLGEFAMTRSRVNHGAPGIGATRSSAFMSVK